MMGLFGCFTSGIVSGILFSQLRGALFKVINPQKAAAMDAVRTFTRLPLLPLLPLLSSAARRKSLPGQGPTPSLLRLPTRHHSRVRL